MAYRVVERQTSKGAPYLWVHTSGLVTLADLQKFHELIKPGAPYHRQRMLSIIEKGTEYEPGARKYMSSFTPDLGPQALVVTSKVLRAALGLFKRFMNVDIPYCIAATEDEALAFLTDCEW